MARLIVVMGPSGVGKTALAMTLEVNGIARRIVTCTTRAPRPGEVPGADYIFCTLSDFMAMNEAGALAESEFIHDHWYGVPLFAIMEALASETRHIVILGPGGADRVKALAPEKVMIIAIVPPNSAALQERLYARGTQDTEATQRLTDAAHAWTDAAVADTVIVNDQWDAAYAALVRVVQDLI